MTDLHSRHLPTRTMALPAPVDRARAGALWLDGHWPGWALKIKTEAFHVGRTKGCVLGQLYGDFSAPGVENIPIADLIRRGFTARGDAEFEAQCEVLTAAWRAEIVYRQLQGARK